VPIFRLAPPPAVGLRLEGDRPLSVKSILDEPDDRQRVLEQAPIGVMLFSSHEGEIVYANPAAVRITGQPLEGPAPMRAHPELHGLRYPDGRPIPVEDLPSWRALRGQVVTGFEMIVTRPDRTPVPISVSASPLREGGRIHGAVAYVEDISDRKELDRLREEHLAVVAHDLRNPIQALLLAVGNLMSRQEEGVARASVSQLQAMQRSLDRLSKLIRHLSDAALIGSGRMALDLHPLALPGVIAALVESIRPALGEHPISIQVQGEPPPILGDPLRIEQIAANLLENAGKHSPPGSAITVGLRCEDGGVLLTVTDQGPGVAPEDLPWLFDRFYQAKRAREKKSGLGLGLYITRGLVEAHRGRVWVDSVPGKGSTFNVWLPAAASSR